MRTGRTDQSKLATVDESVAADFLTMGMKVELDAESASEDFIEIWPANHASFYAWLECQTQWDAVGTPAGIIWTKLPYEAVLTVLDDLGSPRGVFADIRLMEAVALPILNERDD